jgi:MOSC domain-containing protein YiiM
MPGTVETIHIAEKDGAPVRDIPAANLIAGVGIEGDRYAAKSGTFSNNPGDHELTLVEAEVIESLAADHGIKLAPGETRRNITTRGIRLNDLVGKQFRVGEAICEGTRLCEPCAYLEKTTEIGGLVRIMVGRGGLRALIVGSGVVKPGDGIAEVA